MRKGDFIILSSVEYKKAQGRIYGRALISSCKTNEARVILNFSLDERQKFEFKNVAKEIIEG